MGEPGDPLLRTTTADDDRQPRELGTAQHLDRRDELVEVDVQHPTGAAGAHPAIVPGRCDTGSP
jgi:hypothetical protein